jgi:hypothetical protein
MALLRRVFESLAEAERAREAMVAAGISGARIAVSRSSTEDELAGEAPGQSYENQPGQAADDDTREEARFGTRVRGRACVLTVASDSAEERRKAESVLARYRAA